jgi:hypothetical protein
MDITAKLPAMASDALANLHANAKRLGAEGTAAQRASATALLPAIEAELSARKAAAEEQKQARKAQAAAKRRGAAAAAATAATPGATHAPET